MNTKNKNKVRKMQREADTQMLQRVYEEFLMVAPLNTQYQLKIAAQRSRTIQKGQ